MRLTPVIGLETHVQLKTRTKLFCRCQNGDDHAAPNTHICPVCTGHPGTLPVLNEQALRFAIMLGLALQGNIASSSKFDRKNYFYPDLPKAYQISQFDLPLMSEGRVTFPVPHEGDVTITLERMHLEEDAAKNIHTPDGVTLVDFNRSSAPLCEIVTRPEFTSAAQAKAYVQELRLLVRMLGVSDGDMERGHLRCDVNISLREVYEDGALGPFMAKTEVKNINSFRAIERTVLFEIDRQTKLWEAGTPPTVTTTRGWNDEKQETEEQREKETSADYRYFPEPDIPPLKLAPLIAEITPLLPELPQSKRQRFVNEYGFKGEDVETVIHDLAMSTFVEAAYSELGEWIEKETRNKAQKLFHSWIINKLPGLLEERKQDFATLSLTPENFAEFISLLAQEKMTAAKGLEVLARMLDEGEDPTESMEKLCAARIENADELEKTIQGIVKTHTKEVERYKAGETKLFAFFLGQIMKATKGNADPQKTQEILKKILG